VLGFGCQYARRVAITAFGSVTLKLIIQPRMKQKPALKAFTPRKTENSGNTAKDDSANADFKPYNLAGYEKLHSRSQIGKV